MEENCLLIALVGSARYGYASESSDRDLFFLTKDRTEHIANSPDRIDRFFLSITGLKLQFGHPFILGNITGDYTGNNALCSFLREHRREISYAAPGQTVLDGLDCISVGERYGYKSPIKAGLRTAIILAHMAEEREDPFLLSDEEKAILIRARTGDVPPEERAEIYRRTICPANLDKLRRMPENTKVRDELFALLDKICKEGTP